MQRKYVEELLDQLNMKQCKPIVTPMGVNEKLQCDANIDLAHPRVYRSLINKVLYPIHTRPDIHYTINYLSRFTNQPSKHHLNASKHVVRYLAGTTNFGLWFSRCNGATLEGFSNSDWGGSMSNSKSTSGLFFRFGSSAISWGLKKQDIIALSTTDA